MSYKISPQLQQYLKQLDDLQNTYGMVLTQKQGVEAQLLEVKSALSALEKAKDDSEIYKMAGSILVKTGREEVKRELDETKELLEARLKTLEKQESRLTEEIGRLNDTIARMLKKEQVGLG